MIELNSKKYNPVVLILEKYSRLSEHDIIMEVASWFNAIGREEFDKAKNQGIIIQTKDHPELWELVNKKLSYTKGKRHAK